MRRFLRWTFACVSVLSLLACVASAELWWRSRSITDSVWMHPRADKPPLVSIDSNDGIISAVIGDFFRGPSDSRFDAISTIVTFGPEKRLLWKQVPKVQRGTGIGARPQSHVFQFYSVEISPPGGSVGVGVRKWQVVAAPNWLLMLLTASIPAMWAAHKAAVAIRNRRRLRHGLCVACGYDIRAGHDCCPECGRSLKPPEANAVKVRRRHWPAVTMAAVLFGICLWPIAIEFAARRRAAQYQKLADGLEWQWSDDKASLDYSISHAPDDCKIELTGFNPYYGSFARLRLTRGEKEFFAWTSDTATVFVRKGKTLIYADHPTFRGCHVVAVDLEDGRVLWETFMNPGVNYLLGGTGIGEPFKDRRNT